MKSCKFECFFRWVHWLFFSSISIPYPYLTQTCLRISYQALNICSVNTARSFMQFQPLSNPYDAGGGGQGVSEMSMCHNAR